MATATQPRIPSKADKAAAQADRDALVASLVAKFRAEDLAEAGAIETLKAAQLAVEDIRVIKSRLFFQLADTLAYKGEPSLAGATKALHEGKDTKKNTYRPYLLAGAALNEKGWALRTTAPTAEERDVVERAFTAYNKANAKAERAKVKAAKAEAEGTESEGSDDRPTPEGETEALTFATLLAHMARAHATADLLVKTGVPVSAEDVTLLEQVMADLSVKLQVHAA